MPPKLLIDEIRSDFERRARDQGHYGMGMLSSAVERLSVELYQKDSHFLLELIQNAEDNHYKAGVIPELLFVVTEVDPTSSGGDGCFCLFNNEKGFSEDNIRSICSVGESTKKKREGYVGEKGIGFKSVFTVTAEPHLFSNGYQIQFKENDQEAELSYILPYWVETPPSIIREHGMMTSLLLPLKQEKKNEIIRELSRVKPETILFLSKLESLNIQIESSGESIELNRDLSNEPRAVLLAKRDSNDDKLTDYYLYKQRIDVPDGLDEPKREGILDREITLAFPLSDERSEGVIFAYLPTEVESGFPFLVNADFLLTADRGTLLQDRRWNHWIRDSLSDLIVGAIEQMACETDLQKFVCRYIPIPGIEGVRYEYFEHVATEVCLSLRDKPIVLNDRMKMVTPKDVLRASEKERELFPVDDRPDFFEQYSFVAPTLKRYSRQLKEIGVESFSIEKIIGCLNDEKWLTGRELEWFVELYKYLFRQPRQRVEGLLPVAIKLIPLFGGGFAALQEQVYIQTDRKLIDDLQEVTGEKIAPVKLFSNRLYDLLKDDESLWMQIRRALGLEKFSLDHYVAEELIPWLEDNQKACAAHELIDITGFLVHHWKELSEETVGVVGERLPVVLADNAVVNRNDIKDQQLLTPKAFDVDSGWQLFLSDLEVDHCVVLSDQYVKKLSDLPAFSNFLNSIEATSVPHLSSRQFTWSDRVNEELDDSLRAYLKQNLKESTYTNRSYLETWMPPDYVTSERVCHSNQSRVAFLQWLNALLPEEDGVLTLRSPAINATSRYSRWGAKKTRVNSYFFEFLLRKRWVKTSNGCRRGKESFLDTKATRSIFRDQLPYLKDDLSDVWINRLGINREITEEVVVEYLIELSGQQNVDADLIFKIYQYLDQNGDPESFENYFQESDLIYIPNNERTWFRRNEVVWEDGSAVLGSLFGWLSPVYESKGLRNFFINKIAVETSPSIRSYAEAWAALPQQSSSPEASRTQDAIKLIFAEILKMLSEEDQAPLWWEELCEQGFQVWTQSGHFENAANVYALDNQTYANIFRDSDMEYIWKPDNLTHQRMKSLYGEIGVKLLTEIISIRLATSTDNNKSRADVPTYLNDFSKDLIARMVYHTNQEYFESLVSSGKIESLMRISEWSIAQLDLIYENEFGVEKPESNQAGYIDFDRFELIVSSNADREEVMDVVSSSIARFLYPMHEYKKYQDTIRKCLAVSKNRAKDIQDREGWSLSSALRELFQQSFSDVIDDGADDFDDHEKMVCKPEKMQQSNQEQVDLTVSGDLQEEDNSTAKSRVQSQTRMESVAQRGRGGGRLGNERSTKTQLHKFPNAHVSTSERTKKSREINRTISSYSQRRFPVYVESEVPSSDTARGLAEDQINDNERKKIGELAEKHVVNILESEGYDVRNMNEVHPNHPGYDLKAIDKNTGEAFFIEVKGTSLWGEAGVGLSDFQFKEAMEVGANYWLFVVERVETGSPEVHRIKNPFSHVTNYYFSGGWRVLSSDRQDSDAGPDLKDLVVELKNLTNDDGKVIIDYCNQQGWSLPEVGYELLNDDGEVVTEFELAWDDLCLGIVLGDEHVSTNGWTLLQMKEACHTPELLKDYFIAGVEGE